MARLTSLAAALLAATTSPFHALALTAESPVSNAYDFIVIGGGTSGLVLARRLSEDPDIRVLVVEAGPLDQHEDFVDIPGMAMGAVGTKYDWNMTYTTSEFVNGRAIGIPQGHVVGGGSILNAMIWQRGTKRDYANWEAMGAEGWGWDGLLESFEESEIFVGPTEEIRAEHDITVDWSVHDPDAEYGENGVFATYSPWMYPSIPYFLNASAELGIPKIPEPGAGEASGVMYQPRSQFPDITIRCSSRKGYYDPVADKENIDWLFGYKALRLVFDEDTNDRVSGVEFSACPDCDVFTVRAHFEVIVAAGAIGTPALLQRSGIGPKNVLEAAGIEVKVENPNIGMGLTDHYFVAPSHNLSGILTISDIQTNLTLAAEARELYDAERTGPFATVGGDIIFFLATEQYTTAERLAEIADMAAAQDPMDFVEESWSEEFKKAYVKQHSLLVSHLNSSDGTTLECIPNDQRGVLVNIAPFSRGSVAVSSPDAWVQPNADSGFLRNPVDAALLVEAVKWVRKLYATEAMAELDPIPVEPALSVDTDEEIEDWVRSVGTTIFHPTTSCSMGPLELGGAVDPETLKVYGVRNLRLVDSSVMPMIMAGHTQATVYGVAEKAAKIMMGDLKRN